MEQQSSIFRIKGLSKEAKVVAKPLVYGRYLVGTIDSCDVQISHPSIRPIHAVLEISPQGNKIYGLDADSLILVNGEKRAVSKVEKGDTLKVGSVVLDFNEHIAGDGIPTLPQSEVPKNFSQSKMGSIVTEESVKAPHLIYPFDQKYNFDTSEYIFEDNQNIYPIFKYELNKQAVEIIIIHKQRIFSVDYIPELDGVYKLSGLQRNSKGEIHYPYLGKDDNVDFVEVRGGSFFVSKLSDYSLRVFSDNENKLNGSTVHLEKNDILSFQKGDISIVVRNVDPPPGVKAPPFLPRDKSLFFLCILAILLISVPMYFVYNMEIDKEKIEKEKAPERIAKILYNRKAFMKVEKRETKPKETPKPKVKKVEKKQKEVKKLAKKAPGPKVPVKKPKKVKKGSPPKKVTKKPTPAPPNKNTQKKTAKSSSKKNIGKSKSKSTTSSPTPKSRGTVDVYRNNSFKSTVSNLLAKGGQFKGVKTKGSSGGSFAAKGSQGVSGGGGVATSQISDQIGSPTGSRDGVKDFATGAEGIVGTKTFYTAGIPSETVIVGSMDPDIIRKILRDHIPQFRYCYQKELDRNNNRVQGLVKMVFTIGASGSVTRAGIEGASKVPSTVKRCVVNVLRGIQFPRPMGGGRVEVKQPINFYPRSN